MTRIGVRIRDRDNVTAEEIETLADNLNVNKTDVVILALEIIKDFSPEFIETVKDRAKKYGLPIGVVIRNLIAKQMGENAAEWEFWHKEYDETHRRAMHEFAITPDGPISDQEVFENSKQQKYQDLINEQLRHIRNQPEVVTDEKDKEFLKKYGSYSFGKKKNSNESPEDKGEAEWE